ncbi:primosomal protein N' (replication factor Y) - superfamily II helicase [Paenirhodobacter sp. CAU 1674]|jgi:DNA-directed RNA polymerase subunit RPC12/RpoP|uniref:primosomal protein N' (replication factor Y) - superfamily II helicase n=1 Tax=Paenirhodobacter sp. CAU 1674 TaxID=3032596 RepID=UPI0023DB2253|nr:primosomal protein N' (replication factor Y) - superfamily II helicase [Paenirhodobacter sp. CAU 1674]MDF2142100.1 primosomal protein N' (replication factor Y) - superfamily II helicase [Paenirhodobacter sp. CAU 1674]
MAAIQATRPVTEHHYPCESCGADLRFAPGQERMVCDHCGHVQDIPRATGRGTASLRELPLDAVLGARLPDLEMEEHRTLSCPNCGASIEFTGADHAAECPFCATPVVVDTGTRRLIKPQGVLPFVLTEAQARAALGAWLGRLWFAPSGLAQYARRGRKMTGVYAPFWTFDAQSRTEYAGQRGDYYYETRQVRVEVNGRMETRQQQVRHVRWRAVRGRVARAFDDVLVYAARSLPPAYTDALRPWDLSALADYRPDYLAGFSAEGYTVELHEGHHLARAEMMHVIQSDVRRDIGGDEQRIDHLDPEFSAETFKHILLPVWTAAYKFRGQSYRFVVNAQTGKVRGDRPWSAWKIAFAVLLAAVVIGIAVYLNQMQR